MYSTSIYGLNGLRKRDALEMSNPPTLLSIHSTIWFSGFFYGTWTLRCTTSPDCGQRSRWWSLIISLSVCLKSNAHGSGDGHDLEIIARKVAYRGRHLLVRMVQRCCNELLCPDSIQTCTISLCVFRRFFAITAEKTTSCDVVEFGLNAPIFAFHALITRFTKAYAPRKDIRLSTTTPSKPLVLYHHSTKSWISRM